MCIQCPLCARGVEDDGERVERLSVRLGEGVLCWDRLQGAMPKALSEDAAERRKEKLKEKHVEFEGVASEMRGAERTKETTPRGIEQHVVRNGHAILRWPVAYEGGAV